MIRQQPERIVQSQIANLLRSLGASVYTLGTTRRKGDHHGTMQSFGLPDLWAVLPERMGRPALAVWIEVKAPGGKLRPEQARFRVECQASLTEHVVGGVDAVLRWLVEHGRIKAENVPHYRMLTPGEPFTIRGKFAVNPEQ